MEPDQTPITHRRWSDRVLFHSLDLLMDNPIAIPVGAVLHDPFQRGVIDVEQAEALGKTFCPLKIVH
jgi:hypothetical protein